MINFPVGFNEFAAVHWQALPSLIVGKLAFVVIGTTFFTYLFNIYALKQLQPSTIGAFIYLQPVYRSYFRCNDGS